MYHAVKLVPKSSTGQHGNARMAKCNALCRTCLPIMANHHMQYFCEKGPWITFNNMSQFKPSYHKLSLNNETPVAQLPKKTKRCMLRVNLHTISIILSAIFVPWLLPASWFCLSNSSLRPFIRLPHIHIWELHQPFMNINSHAIHWCIYSFFIQHILHYRHRRLNVRAATIWVLFCFVIF